MRIVAAEPLPGEAVQGLRSLDEGFVPPVLDESVLDDKFLVNNRDAVIGLRRLLRDEGVFAGLSCGAAVAVAVRVAREMEAGSVVVLLADGGWKYLSADLWSRDLDELEDELEAHCCGERRPDDHARHRRRADGSCPLGAAERGVRLLAGDLAAGTATAFHPARNAEASPLRYNVHPDDLVRIVFAIEDAR